MCRYSVCFVSVYTYGVRACVCTQAYLQNPLLHLRVQEAFSDSVEHELPAVFLWEGLGWDVMVKEPRDRSHCSPEAGEEAVGPEPLFRGRLERRPWSLFPASHLQPLALITES